MPSPLAKSLDMIWTVIIFVIVPIVYTALLFIEEIEINLWVTVFFISTVFVTSLWNVFNDVNNEHFGFQLGKMVLSIYVTLFAFAALYQRSGLMHHGEISHEPMDALYFSIVTWTTLGYGDFHPVESLRLLAAFQALLGTLFIPLLIAALLFSVQEKAREKIRASHHK